MKTVEVTGENFEATVKEGIVFLDFWASWCGPCRAFAPVFEGAAARHQDVVFGKVNTETEPALAAGFGVRAIPTLLAFREGVLLGVLPGALPGPALDELIEKVRALDMAEIRRKLDEGAPAPRATAGAA